MRIPRNVLLVLLFIVLVLTYILFFSFLIHTFKSKKSQPEPPKKDVNEPPSVTSEESSNHIAIVKQNKYETTDQAVSYAGVLIDDVDRESFSTFSGYRGGEYVSSDYAKDKNQVYFQGKALPSADVKSFRVEMERSFYTFEAEDANAVFLNGKALNIPKKELFLNFYTFPSVRFLVNNGRYWQIFDGTLYYYNVDDYGGSFQELLPVEGIDVSKARPLDMNSPLYVTDGSRVYYQNQKLKGADAATFQVMDGWAKDKDSVYIGAQKLEKADPNSFERIDNGWYYRDRHAVYIKNKILVGADATSFEVVGSAYGKDRRRVYYQDAPIEGADPESFSPFAPYFDGYSKDKNDIFFLGKRVPGADVASFSYLGGCGGGYASDLIVGKDASGVYGNGKLLKGVQPESVQVSESEYVRDSNSILECSKDANGIKIQIDPETFRQNGGYLIGKDGVYFEFRKVVGANPEHFFLLQNANRTDGGFVGISENKVFIKGVQIQDLHAEGTQIDWCGVSTRYLCMYGFVYDVSTGKSVEKMGDTSLFVQATFEQQDILFQNQLAKEEGRPFPDVADFGYGYSKNAGKIYFEGSIVKGVDVETFSIPPNLYGGWATDRNFVYWNGRVVGK